MRRRKIKFMDVVKFVTVVLPAIQMLRQMLKKDTDSRHTTKK